MKTNEPPAAILPPRSSAAVSCSGAARLTSSTLCCAARSDVANGPRRADHGAVKPCFEMAPRPVQQPIARADRCAAPPSDGGRDARRRGLGRREPFDLQPACRYAALGVHSRARRAGPQREHVHLAGLLDAQVARKTVQRGLGCGVDGEIRRGQAGMHRADEGDSCSNLPVPLRRDLLICRDAIGCARDLYARRPPRGAYLGLDQVPSRPP